MLITIEVTDGRAREKHYFLCGVYLCNVLRFFLFLNHVCRLKGTQNLGNSFSLLFLYRSADSSAMQLEKDAANVKRFLKGPSGKRKTIRDLKTAKEEQMKNTEGKPRNLLIKRP